MALGLGLCDWAGRDTYETLGPSQARPPLQGAGLRVELGIEKERIMPRLTPIYIICFVGLGACGMDPDVKAALYDTADVTGKAPTYHAQSTFDGLPRPSITPEDMDAQEQLADDLLAHEPSFD